MLDEVCEITVCEPFSGRILVQTFQTVQKTIKYTFHLYAAPVSFRVQSERIHPRMQVVEIGLLWIVAAKIIGT